MTTYLQTIMHLIKGIIGAGIFSMGVAFKNAGMIMAIIFTPIMGVIVLHCVTLVAKITSHLHADEETAQYLNEKSSYAEIVERVFLSGSEPAKKISKFMKILVNVAVCTMNTGFCCIYVVFVASNMQKVLAYYGVEMQIYLVMLIFIIPMWLSSLITNLRLLAPLSMLANLLLVISIAITLYIVSQDLPPFDNAKYIGEFSTVPLFFAVALYSFESIGLINPLRNEMDKPEKLTGTFGVLNVGFFTIIPFMVAVGMLTYWKYGEECMGTVFLNLSLEDKLVQAVIILVCIQVLFTYPVQLYIPVAVIWPFILEKYGPFKRELPRLLLFRSCLVLLTLIVGEAIPFIDLIISLVGAICSTILTLFIPPFMELVVFYPQEKSRCKKTFLLVKNISLFILAIAIFVFGVYASIRDIVHEFNKIK